ncbi:dipeptide transport system permease protein DppB [Candidatus Vecturithrix granuli]|uniref:Dipeptide transport system permease protein DppB n=1 Tax=Vecturithrix granuli TaxID=1499967 RepID=A0A081BVQ7_VECG1|nr:dipeptide transport system permease protein DppB [Candidatus Vecturithrix granuli]
MTKYMRTYILRRLIQTVVVIFLLSFVSYYLMNLMPGDPIDIMIMSNPRMTPEDADRLKKLYGFDKPIHVRYWIWLTTTLSGDLGYSRTYRVPVGEILGRRLLNTFYLSTSALLLSLAIGIPIGIFSALRKGSSFDYAVNLFAFAGISIPSFFLGILLLIVFAIWLKWFPAGGTQTVGANLTGFAAFADRVKFIILPMCSLTAQQMAQYVRYMRSSMVETMHFDFIRTARAKGLPRRRVLFVHALRNALIPVVTIVALSISFLFSGAIITETLFAYQGAGKLVYDSIIANDFNVAMVSFNITVGMVLIMNLIADILYAYLDPRISYK